MKQAGRPRGNNYEKNKFYRTPKEFRNSEKDLPIEKMDASTFKQTPIYSMVKSTVNQIVEVNNNRYGSYKDVYNGKNVLYNDEQAMLVQGGVQYYPLWRISPDDLRWIAYSSSLVGSIHQIVSDDVSKYTKFNKDPGYAFKMKEIDETPSDIQKLRFKDKGQFINLMGSKDIQDWRERERFHEVLEMATRDTLTIDKVAYLKTYNKAGELTDIRYLDPATILRVDPKNGYKDDKKITHVQVVNNSVVETFERGRIVMRSKSNLSDLKFRSFGFSPLESCVQEILGMLYALRTNTNRWNDVNPPKMLAYTGSTVSESQKQQMQLEWENAFSGPKSNFRLPILFGMGELSIQKLEFGDDIQFDKWIQFTASLIITRHGIDPAVLGIKLNQSQALSESSTDGRQTFSKDRQHGAMMSFHEDCFNEILDPNDELPYTFSFTGVKENDKNKKVDLHEKEFRTGKFLDEIRNEDDLPSMRDVADDYVKRGIITKEEGDKLAKVGLINGNQYVAGQIGAIIGGEAGADADSSGGLPPDRQTEDEFSESDFSEGDDLPHVENSLDNPFS